MLYRMLAGLSIKYSKEIIVLWLGFLVVLGFYAAKLPAVLKDHGLRVDGVYAEVQQMLSEDFHIPNEPVVLLFEKKDPVSREQFHQAIEQALTRVERVQGIKEVISPLARGGMVKENLAYALLAVEWESREIKPALERLRGLLDGDERMTVAMTGKPVVQEDVNRTSHRDLLQAEMIGIPVAFIILWLAFGGLLSSLIPVAVGWIAVIGTMGILYWLGSGLELSIFVLNVIPMVGLALSIDFALMLVSRFREELRHHSLATALRITLSTAGRAVFFSALCVYLGLASTFFIQMPIFNTVAIGAILVLTVSLLLSFTLVPALLVAAGGRIGAEGGHGARSRSMRIWHALSAFVMRRPLRMALLAAGLLLVCLVPLARMNLAVPDAASLPQNYESRQAAEQVNAHFFPSSSSQVFMIAQSKQREWKLTDWQSAYELVQQLERDPAVLAVDSIYGRLPMTPKQMSLIQQDALSKKTYGPILESSVQGNRMLISLTLQGSASSKEALDWVRNWQAPSSDLFVLMGGEPKYQQEVYDEIINNIKYILLFIFVSNFLILYLAFRSFLIPVKTILMNLLSLGAAFGILAWIFEDGRFGMEPSSIALMIPVFIFGLAFGISMDYGVFLLSRIYEIYQRTQDNECSVQEGLAVTSKIITSAAAIMIAVTAPFALGGVAGVKQLGIGIASVIFIDATLVRMMLVPSLMKLLGKWNWWMPWSGGSK
ncbi:MMPL family transporter [Paenibacillus sp. J2TS4]|uniref:MMPL family transporter n=1 Tax=Paenibacillus sp. J2TS4 TaxID=2807194 RepID=UPI001B1C2333|nr:MMPL family transporter [Paenibacillus sp. J2TS4]GIP32236.1 transporter [Paenibacillus sp. J2TS4]